jgi:hypothetical protein
MTPCHILPNQPRPAQIVSGLCAFAEPIFVFFAAIHATPTSPPELDLQSRPRQVAQKSGI